MPYIDVIWDLDDDTDGNVHHIAEHGVTKDEVEHVLCYNDEADEPSRSSGLPTTYGWTETGKHILVVWEKVDDDPLTAYPVTAYEVPPKGGN